MAKVIIKFDNEHRPIAPTFVLATRSGKKLGTIPADEIEIKGSLENGYNISFIVNKSINGNEVELWDKINSLKLVWAAEWDVWFETSVSINETNHIYKKITATSIGEAELSQVMLHNIEINTETDIARDDYKPTTIYNSKDPSASLLDRIMEKTPHYKIEHIDISLLNIQRTFTFNDKPLRDSLNEIAKEIDALLVINSGTDVYGKISRSISLYDLKEHCNYCGHRGESSNGICPKCGNSEWSYGYGDDSGIFICVENLSDNIDYETNTSEVKNCFKLEGGDDLMTTTIAGCCPSGSGYLWYLSDDMKSDMSDALRNKIDSYDELSKKIEQRTWLLNNSVYNSLAKKYGKSQINSIVGYSNLLNAMYDTIDFKLYLEHNMMPEINIPVTTANDQMTILLKNLSPVAVQYLDVLSSTTATSYISQAARAIIDPRYSVNITNATLNGNVWYGTISITRYSDDTDTITKDNISVILTEDYAQYIKTLIDRTINTTEFQDMDIVALFDMNNAEFTNEINKYCLALLKTFYDACQSCLNVLIERGAGNDSILPDTYNQLYSGYYSKRNMLQQEITLRENEISAISNEQDLLNSKINQVHDELNFEKYLGETLWLEFAAYRREDTYRNENYISDGLSNAELFDNAREFIKTANEDIIASATLQHTISSTLYNLLTMPEFEGITDKFELGNWMRIRVDNKIYILRLIEYSIKFNDLRYIEVAYSNVIYKNTAVSDMDSLQNSFSSMASSYGSVSRQASHGNNSSIQLHNWVTEGLAATHTRFISDAVNQNIVWDTNGLLFRKYDEVLEDYLPEQLRIINSTIAVTDDDWASVKTAVGGFDYKDPVSGQIKHGYGINAELLIGKLILGEELGLYNENNSLTFDRNGLKITNNVNSFEVNPNGSTLFSVTCGKDKVMWLDEDGALHLKPKEFSLTTGETLQDAIDAAKNAQNLQIVLTNEYEGIPTDCNGNYTGELSVKTGVITFYGQVDVTNDCSYTISKSDDVTGNWNLTAHEYTITALTTDSGYVDITAKYKNVFTVTKRFNVSKVKAGSNGNDGRGISSVTVSYALSTQGSTPPTNGWQIAMPILTQGVYLWTRTITAYTDNSPSTTSYSVGLIGEDGSNGVDGRGIKETEVAYQKSLSGIAVPTGTWGTVIPTVQPGEYLWTRTKFVYTDNSESASYSVGMMGQTGIQGLQGKDGSNGIDGKTTYLHIKYTSELKDDRSQIIMTEIPSAYIGTLTDFIEKDSNNPADYTWSKFQGVDGRNGEDGVPGAPGADGKTTYFHSKYMTKDNYAKYETNHNDPTVVMTELVAEYMGTYVDYVEKDSESPKTYTWMKVQGSDGIPGTNGADGRTSYLHIKYSDDGGITFTSNNGEDQGAYIGQYVDFIQADSNNPADYKWSRIEGIDGEDGQPGVSNYFHVKYSHIEHPLTSADMTEIPDDYIGTYVDEVKADSNDPKKYTWTRFRGLQGENGEKGIPGKNGEDGTTYYLHIKYMTADNYAKFSANNNDTSVVMTETPSEYIGQLVDTTEADSNVAKDYKWSRIEGIDGQTYTLEVSANSVKRNPDGSLTPNQLVLKAFRRDGKCSQRVPIQAYYFIFPTADGTNYTGGLKSTSPNSSYTFNLSEIATENTIAFKVLASETTSQADAFDTQTIPILRDGKDGKDGTEMTPEEVFNKLTDNGTKQGLYMSDDGDIYFNAEYIKSGTISALNIEGCNISATLGDWVANYNAAGMSFWDNTNSKTKFSIDRYMTFSFGSTYLGSQPCIRTDYLPLMGSTDFGFYNLLFAPYGLPNVNGEYTPGVIWISGGHGINMSSFEGTTPDGQYIPKHNLVIHGSTQYGLSNGMYLYPVAIDDSVFSPTIATNTLYTQNLNVTGGKYRVVDTDTYGVVSMSAVESATPMFMDTGSGCIGNDGKIDILYDEKFSETIDVVCESQVFITPTSAKKINYIEKHTGYFTVYGDADATFDWIVYCPQKGYTTERLENAVCPDNANVANIDETIFEQNGSADFATQEDMKEYTSISQNLLEEGEDSNL